MQKSIKKMTGLSFILSLFAMMAMPAQYSDAQVVPYRADGTGIGNLLDLTAFGDGRGLHLGNVSWSADETVVNQVAADGSTLQLLRVQILFFEISDPDPETGLVVLTLMEELQILGGTGRFQNAQAVEGNIIATDVTEPFDPDGDVTALPFVFELLGQIDLGRR